MYPVAPDLDKVNCLASLVKVRSACPPETKQPAFFAEDLEGWNVKRFAKLADSTSMKGEAYAEFLIGSAAREMMGDIELMMNNGYSMKAIVGDGCSNCQLQMVYTANAGIVVTQAAASNYSVLRITRLEILTNVTGTETFVIDDGTTVTPFEVTLTAGLILPVVLDYSTTAKSVKIYFQNPLVGLGQVYCATTSSCGCGGSVTANNPFAVSGLLAGNPVSTQYGFLPCVSITCSYDTLVCKMIKNTPNIFGLALLFKLGEKVIVAKGQAERNNDTASYNDDSEKELVRNYGQLYWAKMKGSRDGKGIEKIINNYLKTVSSDRCVECETKIYSAWVTG